MATVDGPRSHSEQLWFIIDLAGTRYATIAIGVILGFPLVAFLSGDPTILFYVHIGLGAFWFGLDFSFDT